MFEVENVWMYKNCISYHICNHFGITIKPSSFKLTWSDCQDRRVGCIINDDQLSTNNPTPFLEWKEKKSWDRRIFWNKRSSFDPVPYYSFSSKIWRITILILETANKCFFHFRFSIHGAALDYKYDAVIFVIHELSPATNWQTTQNVYIEHILLYC